MKFKQNIDSLTLGLKFIAEINLLSGHYVDTSKTSSELIIPIEEQYEAASKRLDTIIKNSPNKKEFSEKTNQLLAYGQAEESLFETKKSQIEAKDNAMFITEELTHLSR